MEREQVMLKANEHLLASDNVILFTNRSDVDEIHSLRYFEGFEKLPSEEQLKIIKEFSNAFRVIIKDLLEMVAFILMEENPDE